MTPPSLGALRRAFGHVATQLALAVVGVASVILLLVGARASQRARERTRSLVQEVGDARLNLTKAYLVIGRVAAGDSTFSLQDAVAYAENAHADLRDLLGGTDAGQPAASPLVADDTLRAMLAALDQRARAFDSVAHAETPGTPMRAMENVDRRVAFGAFERLADTIDARLDARLNALDAAAEWDVFLTLGAWVVFLVGMGAVVHALTRSRRRAELQLRRNEARYRLLSSLAPVGIFRADADGRMLDVNERCVLLASFASDSLIGRSWFDAVHPQERQRVREAWRDALEHDKEFRVECRLAGSDTRERWVLARAARVDGAGVVGTLIDISDRKHVELQLQQAQKLESVGELTGGIAHDFNNLLAVIATNAELLEPVLPPNEPEAAAMLYDVREAVKSGTELVRGLVGFSRRADLRLEEVRLADVIQTTGKLMRRVVPASITVRADDVDDTVYVHADPVAIQQILLNLATNARDAMPKGGVLTLEVRWRDADEGFLREHPWAIPGWYGILEVHDTGTGMSEAVRSRIFEPFYTTKPVGRGTGLGLAMVYGLVRQQFGFVHVYSELGHGTRFVVGLPASTATAQERHTPSGRTHAFRSGSEHVLVLEDQDSLRRALCRTLEHLGYRVTEAPDGAAALALLEGEHDIDLVIADIVMPGMGGIDVFDRLEGRAAPPFIFTSGYTARDIQERAKLPEYAAFLRKPWTLQDLNDQLRTVLDT
ncbi:MAG TPA: ATP-binding protein [Gemmatimonadales bacterium]|nr:ATP-binding protein [Gemmatimonadales bacterium]